ncbi:MAG: thioredoxin [Clostridia bacterium]|nr:thioredoxin [Clostridia bacterium]
MEIVITAENFEKEVLQSDKKVVLDFWASWCGPCMMLAPVLEEISNERDDIIVGKVNVDEQPELSAQFGIVSIPTLMLFEKGAHKDTSVGYINKAQLEKFIG